jgi:hypothetical protein
MCISAYMLSAFDKINIQYDASSSSERMQANTFCELTTKCTKRSVCPNIFLMLQVILFCTLCNSLREVVCIGTSIFLFYGDEIAQPLCTNLNERQNVLPC